MWEVKAAAFGLLLFSKREYTRNVGVWVRSLARTETCALSICTHTQQLESSKPSPHKFTQVHTHSPISTMFHRVIIESLALISTRKWFWLASQLDVRRRIFHMSNKGYLNLMSFLSPCGWTVAHFPHLGDDLRPQRVNVSPRIALWFGGTPLGESSGFSRSVFTDASKSVRNTLWDGGGFPLLSEHMLWMSWMRNQRK